MKQRLVSLGLSPDIIHIHPDNLHQQSIDEINYAKKEYGSPKYIQGNLNVKLDKLTKVKDEIINFSTYSHEIVH